MAEIGKLNRLEIIKELDFGVYLDGENLGEILLPRRYLPKKYDIGDVTEVFIYLDSEDRLIATTEKPLAMVGEFAYLKVTSVNPVGAFLDWGLPKDLLVPFREQKLTMIEGKSYIVYLYEDKESSRIVASAKIEKFLDNLPPKYQEGEEVQLLICFYNEIGYKAIINSTHTGILYKNEIFQPLKPGKKIKGYIKKVRPDDKIDLCLHKPGFEKVDELSEKILKTLQHYNGFMKITDKSSPEDIYEMFSMSKKTFKKSIGMLYKKKLITLEENGIRLV